MDTKKLRQKILDLAIHGKLVPQDPNDEPASVLLERIRKEKEQLIKEGKIKAPKKSKTAGDTSHYPKEGPWELPRGWVWCHLSDLASFAGGKTPSMDNKDFWKNGKHLWITSKDMKSRYLIDSQMKISDTAVREMTVFHPGTILMVNRSGILRRTLPLAILNAEATINQDIKAIVPYLLCISPYLYYAILSQESFILSEYKKAGTTVDNINFDKFISLLIPLPPQKEQDRIVSSINQYFAIIENIDSSQKELNTSLEAAKAKILDLAIRGKLEPQDPNEEPAIELLKRINPNFKASDNLHYEGIPQSWTVCRLSDVCVDFIVPQRDKPKIFDGDIPWCRIEDIEGKYLNGSLSGRLVSKKTIQQMNMRICPVGTVICSCSASIGTQAIVTQPCCTNQTFIGLVPDDRFIYNEFLYYFLASQTEQFLDIGTGTTIKYISREKFEEYRIPLPPLVEQRRIVERIEYCFLLLKQIQSATSIC